MLSEIFQNLKGDLIPKGIRATIIPEEITPVIQAFLNAKSQLMVEVPEHRKSNKFHLNTLRKVSW